MHECSRHALIASFGACVNSTNTACGKPGGPHTQLAFIDSVATNLLAVAICAAHLLLAIAGEGSEPVQQPVRRVLWQRVRRKRLRNLNRAFDMLCQLIW